MNYIPELDELGDVDSDVRMNYLHDLIEWIDRDFFGWLKQLHSITKKEVDTKATIVKAMSVVDDPDVDVVRRQALTLIEQEIKEEFMTLVSTPPVYVPIPELEEE